MNTNGFRHCIVILAGAMACLPVSPAALARAGDAAAQQISPDQLDFFEKKIRPLLVDRCIDCHSEDASGGLQLDSAAAVLRGGVSGTALVPGKPDESRLIHAVRGQKGMKAMPPDDPLSDEEIADLVKWVETGAADPRTAGGSLSPLEQLYERARTHWAFQPIANPQPPTVRAKDLVQTPIDAFIQAALEAKGWSMSPRADGRTLVRRASLDLTGMPPAVSQVDAFAADASPAVFESAVDNLLASPRYGERWARHWLDVARYADSMGFGGGGGQDKPYPFAWTYRDWCVRAFNEDMPFDRFVVTQLAGDLASVTPDDNRNLAALGFFNVGRRPNDRVDDDVIDDRIDVITRGVLGLSVSCARCHDHKLEPIATRDYYGLYGVLKSCAEPAVYPAMKPQPLSTEYEAYAAENRRAREHYIRVMAFEAERAVGAQRSRLGDYLLAVHDGRWKWVYEDNNRVDKEILKPRGLNSTIYGEVIRGRKTWLDAHPAVFRPWLELSALPPEEFAAKSPAMMASYAANADDSIAKVIAAAFASDKPQTIADVASIYNRQAQSIESMWGERFRGALDKLCGLRPDEEDLAVAELQNRAILRIHEADLEALRPGTPLANDNAAVFVKAIVAEESPFVFRDTKKGAFLSRDVAEGLRRNATTAVTKLADHPGAPIRLMALAEDKPFDAKVFIRGNPQSPGEPAPRQYLSVLRTPDASAFPKDASGRKELAELIASPKNPLTARVIVNRVWAWHFGQGLVRTASDFGLQGESPSHPELLDWLASRFIADGWSLKKLHRLIMQSHVYQQAATVGTGEAGAGSARALDPDNRLLWRFPSRPLEFEALRDAMLVVGGGLDETVGGRPFNIDDAAARRRSIYAKIDRKQVAAVMRAFNVPDSNFTSFGRSRTALPPQALWLFNSPFAVETAKRLAAQVQAQAGGPGSVPAAVIRGLWQAVLQRDPSPAELADAEAFVASYPKNDIVQPQTDDWSYGFADFDAAAKTVNGFTPINAFAGAAVRGPKTADFDGTVMEMTPDGGKAVPGKASVRRWTSPEKGTVKIEAELVRLMPAAPQAAAGATQAAAGAEPAAAEPDGARITCRIVHSRHGQLGEWTATPDGVITKVETVACEPGDTIDFVALTDLDPARSGFIWSPTIVMVDRDMPALPGMPMRWDARHDFLDPKAMPKPLGPWEELTQVLLVSGEFMMLP